MMNSQAATDPSTTNGATPLEVATELEDTVRKGDFLANLERDVDQLFKVKKSRSVRSNVIGDEPEKGEPERLDWSIFLPVKTVLAGRQVDPKDVVGLFGDNRFIDLKEVEPEGQCFVLTQRHIGDEDYLKRIEKLKELMAAHTKKTEQIHALIGELNERTRLLNITIADIRSGLEMIKTFDESVEGKRLKVEKTIELRRLSISMNRQQAERAAMLEVVKNLRTADGELPKG